MLFRAIGRAGEAPPDFKTKSMYIKYLIPFIILLINALFFTAYYMTDSLYISDSDLGAFPIYEEAFNCQLVSCTMHDNEGNELWVIKIKKESYNEFIQVIEKGWNAELIEAEWKGFKIDK